jgi:hypothetical protein
MDSLKGVLSDIRTFMYGGVATLPVTIAGTMLILGLCTANYAMLFFLIGYLMGVPLISYGLNFGLQNLLNINYFKGFWLYNQFKVKRTGQCGIVVDYSADPKNDDVVISSIWMSMVTFFIGYLLTNAYQLYNRDTEDTTIRINQNPATDRNPTPDLSKKVTNRKTQAIIAIISIIVFAIAVIGTRIYGGCDRIAGSVIGGIIFGSLGLGWYILLSLTGHDRLSDLFGIANRLLPPSAIENKPIACVAQPA